jgi:prolyl-tRNA editing enzyme YbaK/EbsC (Cys-tRNA(Pro) deacylase)
MPSAASAVLTSPSVERVRHALKDAGLPFEIIELPGAARTAKAAAEFLGCDLAQIANSLVFRGECTGEAVLVMSSGAKRVDLARLSIRLGEAASKADADFVRARTGFAIGGVAPVGHGLTRVFVEQSLAAFPELWAAAGHPQTVFRLSFQELLRVTNGTPAELSA